MSGIFAADAGESSDHDRWPSHFGQTAGSGRATLRPAAVGGHARTGERVAVDGWSSHWILENTESCLGSAINSLTLEILHQLTVVTHVF